MVSTYDHGKAISVSLSELYRFSLGCVIRHNNVSPTTVNTIRWHFHLPINACLHHDIQLRFLTADTTYIDCLWNHTRRKISPTPSISSDRNSQQ